MAPSINIVIQKHIAPHVGNVQNYPTSPSVDATHARSTNSNITTTTPVTHPPVVAPPPNPALQQLEVGYAGSQFKHLSEVQPAVLDPEDLKE